MDLKDIGFYTLSDQRAANVSLTSDLQRCELILTSRCNFKCPYCRGMKKEDVGDISYKDAEATVIKWASNNLKNIRFSGGEPTLWDGLENLVILSKHLGIERIAVSTNGSAEFEKYLELVNCGVNDFSISLDSCCASTGNKMAGGLNVFDRVSENIRRLSKITYVTVGVVLTEENQAELDEIISFATSLGVSDIRVIPAAQIRKDNKGLDNVDVKGYKILQYRISNFLSGKNVRGISESDSHQCPLVLDDMAVMNNKHYPCIIYMREHGEPIGDTFKTMRSIRLERYEWFMSHNCHTDDICKNNCLDVCVDYNNKVKELNKRL